MKLSKMTVRWLMVVVATVAVSIIAGQWTWGLFEVRSSYLRAASRHRLEVAAERANLANFEKARALGASLAEPKVVGFERATRLRVAYHDELAWKYQKAANRPWAPLPADPVDPASKLFIAIFLNEKLEGEKPYLDELQAYSAQLDEYSRELNEYGRLLELADRSWKAQPKGPPTPSQFSPPPPPPASIVPQPRPPMVPLMPVGPIRPLHLSLNEFLAISLMSEDFPSIEFDIRRAYLKGTRVGK